MKTLLALALLLVAVPVVVAQAVATLPLTPPLTPPLTRGPVQGTIAVAPDARITPDMARVTEADARATTLRAVPGATVTEIDLEEEDGFLVYDVDLVAGAVETDVTIDAGSGAVLCTERD